ncbi:MAG TPA: E3 binding domain-containing protein, partial [Aquabacterium sp.]|nr:E3 binding domain-containing protein [Aquabacterium sp.]
MAIVEVKVPQLSESVAEATLLQWKKRPGEAVAIDEILIEIETDKVVLEVPAPVAGVMAQIVCDDGATVASDQVIARIDTEAGAAVSPLEVKAVAAAAPASAPPAPAAVGGTSKADVAMPAAAKLMADNNLAAGSVAGTGKDGRVTKGDVLAAVAAPKPAPAAAPVAAPVNPAVAKPLPAVAAPTAQNLGERPEQRVPMSRLRARIA